MPCHEAYETCLARTGHNFFALRGFPHVKDWERKYRPVPPNYVLLDPGKGWGQLPPDVDFDVVLQQNKACQFGPLSHAASRLQLPLVSLEHCLPPPGAAPSYLEGHRALKGYVNVFISAFSREAWGWGEQEATVVHHGIDTDLFCPAPHLVRQKAHALSVVNDWVNRDVFCGYKLWREATEGLPVMVVGDTPGLSKPAASVAELVLRYREARVFVNTSLVSPVPTSLLEAMACGCACVSTSTCMIPHEVIEHGKNGLMSNDPAELRSFVQRLLTEPEECRRLGEEARKTALEKFSLGRFVREWDGLLRKAAGGGG